MKKITSITNESIKSFSKLNNKKFRDESNLFIVEGKHLVKEAIENKIVVEVISSKQYESTTILVTDEIIKKISTTKTPQDILAICKKIKTQPITSKKVLALDNVQDPGNLGTIIRTAIAFGWKDIVYSGVDLYNPKTIRSSQGSLFKANIIRTDNILKYSDNFEIVGAILDDSATHYKKYKYKEPFMLVLGNEANGISKKVQEKLDGKIYIPIKFESLNVAQAAGIIISQL